MDYKGKYSNQSSWCPWLWLSKPYEGTLFSCYTPPCFNGTGSNLPLPEFPTLLPLITSWRVMKHFKFCVKLTGVVEVGKGGFGTLDQGFEMSLSRGGNVASQGSALESGCCYSSFSWEPPVLFNARSSSFPKFSLRPFVTLIWKFWAEVTQGCRTEESIAWASHLLPTHRKS